MVDAASAEFREEELGAKLAQLVDRRLPQQQHLPTSEQRKQAMKTQPKGTGK